MDWSQDILHLNSKFECWKYPAHLSPAVSTSIRTYTHTRWMCKCWDCGSVCFPDTEATIPSGSHHFPAFLLMSWPSTASPGSRNSSANDVSLSSDICVTKGMWTCQDNCRQRTLRRGEPEGSILAPLLNVCQQISNRKLSVTVFKRRSNGMPCRTFEL